jgi:hypothetical protein
MYRLHVSNDPKIIGARDGRSLIIEETPDLARYEQIPEFSEAKLVNSLDCFRLVSKAKIIDVLKCGNGFFTTGILVSERVKLLMEQYNCHSTQFISCTIKTNRGVIDKYYLLHCYSYLLDKIDYSKTSFSRFWPTDDKVMESYGFIDEKKLRHEIMENAGSVQYIEPDSKYVFAKFNHKDYDLFRIGYIDDFIYVSDKLKDAIEKVGAVGFEFSSARYLFE